MWPISTVPAQDPDLETTSTFGGLLRPLEDDRARRVALAAPRSRPACAPLHEDWSETTHGALVAASLRLGEVLARQLPAGGTLALLTSPRPEWMIVFLGCVQAGLVLLPLEPKLTAAELRAILDDAQPDLLVASVDCAALAAEIASATLASSSMDALLEESAPAGGWPVRRPHPEDTALLVYSSGTTGRPKGVRVGLTALVHQVRALTQVMEIGPRSVFLSMLPVSHMLGITGGLLTVLHAGGEACFAKSALPDDLTATLRARRVTHLVTVPLFLRLLKGNIEAAAATRGLWATRALRGLLAASGALPTDVLRRALFRGVRQRLGGALTTFVSGGAPLDREVEHFFARTGLRVLQGYGLTETGPVITVNTPRHRRARSVGRALPGVDVRISAEGEILTRGPHLLQGYHRCPHLTQEAIDRDGFFHTGDLGRLDRAGYLEVTGRRKSLIVLASGQKVHPEEVEEAILRHPEIQDACVLPRPVTAGLLAGTDAVWAVVVPRTPFVAGEADTRLAAAVHAACRELSPWKRPMRVVVCPAPFARSASLKVKRHQVARWLDARLDGEAHAVAS